MHRGQTLHPSSWIVLVVLALSLVACGPPVDSPLKLRSSVSSSVFLAPTSPEQRTIYVRVRSGMPQMDAQKIQIALVGALYQRGYQVVSDPRQANLTCDVSIRSLIVDPRGFVSTEREGDQQRVRDAFTSGVFGAVIGGVIGGITGSRDGIAKGALAGGAIGTLSGASRQPWTSGSSRSDTLRAIADVVIGERASLTGFDRGSEEVSSVMTSGSGTVYRSRGQSNQLQRIRHQTSVTTEASTYDVQAPEVLDALAQEMASSIAGLL